MFTHAVQMPPDVAQLVDAYQQAHATEKAAAELKNSLSAQLKVAAEALTTQAGLDPAATRLVWEGPDVNVSVTPTETWRLDTTRLKKEHPAVYASFAVKSVSTRLSVKAGEQ